MAQLNIHDQPGLGARRSISLTLTGIRYRLFRSFVSVMVIAVAVAFLANTLTGSLIRRNIHREAAVQMAELRLASRWAARLSTAGSLDALVEELATADDDAPVWQECPRFGSLTDEEMSALRRDVREVADAVAYFMTLKYGDRRELVRATTGTAILDRLQDPSQLQHVFDAIGELRLRRMERESSFRDLLKRWLAVRVVLERILDGRRLAIEEIARAQKDPDLLVSLLDSDAAFEVSIREAGFAFSPSTAAVVKGQARLMLNERILAESMQQPSIKKALAAKLNCQPDEIKPWTLWELLANESSASWYISVLGEKEMAGAQLKQNDVTSVALRKLEERDLANILAVEVAQDGGFLGLGERLGYLLLISMLVCAVGIGNAMLMSVTERFREIATLKCLGALDGSILIMFVMEAGLLGVVGGVVGAAAGNLIAVLHTALSFGSKVFSSLPAEEMLVGFGASVGIGIGLAMAAAVLPSYKAARLAPMEAMRIE